MTYGPMVVGIEVYEDFFYYSSGVYEHVTGSSEGGHAMKLVGWGVDTDGELYWIIQN
jgi:cathepsin B